MVLPKKSFDESVDRLYSGVSRAGMLSRAKQASKSLAVLAAAGAGSGFIADEVCLATIVHVTSGASAAVPTTGSGNAFTSVYLDGDTQEDFRVYWTTNAGGIGSVRPKGANSNNHVVNSGFGASTGYAAALAPGALIGPGADFATVPEGRLFRNYGLGWSDGVSAIEGVSFHIGADTHYAWLRVRVDVLGATTKGLAGRVTLVDYAYEDQPNTPILAGAISAVPEPSAAAMMGLASLAAGAVGIGSVRRRRKEEGVA